MAKDTLLSILAHQKTRDLMGRLARGDDPRRAVAELAGLSLAEGLAKAMGADGKMVRRAVQAAKPQAAKTDDGITDAEFTVINVTEQARKAKGKK